MRTKKRIRKSSQVSESCYFLGVITPPQAGALSRMPPGMEHAVSGRVQWNFCTLEISCFGPVHDPTPPAKFHHIGICLDALPLKMGMAIDGRSSQAELSPGSLCLMPAGASFRSSWDRQATLACLYFTPESLLEVVGEEYAGSDQEFFPRLCLRSPAVSRSIRVLHQDALRGHPFGKMLGDSIFVSIAASLVQDARVTWKRTCKGGIGDRRIRAALEYIHCNFSQPISVLEIAEAAETSPFHLTRTFRAATGDTLWQYVLRQRLLLAEKLMMDRGLSLAEIAMMSGFESYSAFAAGFLAKRGISAAKHRRDLA